MVRCDRCYQVNVRDNFFLRFGPEWTAQPLSHRQILLEMIEHG
jgi:hypothetical protein